jgi:hypothetical protein
MRMTTSMHYPIAAYARDNAPHGAVLAIRDGNGCGVDIYMPYAQAKAMADAFNATAKGDA